MDKAKQDKQLPQNRPHQGKAPKGEPQRPGVDQPERGRQGEDKPDVERERLPGQGAERSDRDAGAGRPVQLDEDEDGQGAVRR
jgi:hypothetical protein